MSILDNIQEVSEVAPKRSSYQVLAKLMEELGELSVEVNIKHGNINKKGGSDGILGECCDVIIAVTDLLFLEGYSIKDIEATTSLKLEKWKRNTSKINDHTEYDEVVK